MMELTKEQKEMLMKEAKEILQNMEEGKSARDVMAEIYVRDLEDKTETQGRIMADAVLEAVRAFDADYKDAQENPESYVDRFLKKEAEGKSCEELCNYWLMLSASVSAASVVMNDENADREALLEEIRGLSVSAEEATPQREKELRRQAKEAIMNSGILFGALADQAEMLAGLESADEAAELLIDLGSRDLEYRGIAAMLAYTRIKRGEFENIPADITAEQVATIVCAGVEQTRILEAVGNGSMSMEIATALLEILGMIVIIKVALAAAAVGLGLAAGCFSLILCVPACIMVIAGVLYCVKRAMEAWEKVSGMIVNKAAAVIRTVRKGIEAVIDYVKDRLIPAVIERGKKILDAVQGKNTAGGEREEELEAVPAD